MDWTSMSALAASILERAGAMVPEGDAEWQETIIKARDLREKGELGQAVRLYRRGLETAEKSLGAESGEYWFLLVYMLTDLAEFVERKDLARDNDSHLKNAKATIEALQKMLATDASEQA